MILSLVVSTKLFVIISAAENNTVVVRPDFTPSIARCAAKYFCDSNEPLRLSYLGSAFTRTDSLQGKLEESLKREDYEKAAVYRDYLKALEKSPVSGGED